MHNLHFEAKQILCDVAALSKKLCPIQMSGWLVYATDKNFLGRIVNGYHPDAQDIFLLTKQAAYSLCAVQTDLNHKGLGLYIYDSYRPLRAVKDFGKWFTEPVANEMELQRKKIHYPNLAKTDLPRLGYASGTLSKHNFGNTIDLTLIDLEKLKLKEMGTIFDFFDELSHHTMTSKEIGEEAFNNRKILSEAMQKHGFIPYVKEFWHYEYNINETTEPLDLPIDKSLKFLNVT